MRAHSTERPWKSIGLSTTYVFQPSYDNAKLSIDSTIIIFASNGIENRINEKKN